ncbi:hypothetical protein SADUNF_Sadunf03G0120000 [Salix dunnii]|uniref:Uncharacterized protein n=1 Tax=Salix dunnii TaxID=1413687 RepID=A0A835TEG3_9ROSI|nr:hypothetical protein SADUNF_Sadunf03G0120000 [Salix dunnii]
MGCGGGYVFASIALMPGQDVTGVSYTAIDINPHALTVTNAHGADAELVCMAIAYRLEKKLAGIWWM